MLNAMSQGRSGSMCTIHSDSSAGVFRRIASYAVQAPERLPLEATNLLVAGAVHFVVYLDIEHPTLTGDHAYEDDYGRVPPSWSSSDIPEHAGHRSAPSGSPSGVDEFDSSNQDDQATWFAGPARRQRFVSSIREVVDAEGSQVISNEIFRPGPDRRAVVGAPLRPETLRDLIRHGYEPSSDQKDHERVWT